MKGIKYFCEVVRIKISFESTIIDDLRPLGLENIIIVDFKQDFKNPVWSFNILESLKEIP